MHCYDARHWYQALQLPGFQNCEPNELFLMDLGFFVTITENRLRQRVIWHRYTLQRNQKNFVTYFVSLFALNPNVIIVTFKSTQQLLLLKWGGCKKATYFIFHRLFSSILLLLDRMFSAGIPRVQDRQRKKNEFCSSVPTRPHANPRAQ